SADAAGKPGAGKTGTAVEDGIARQKQVDDAAARVKELEKNVGDLEKLMAVKSKAAATAQADAPAAASAASVPVIDTTTPAAEAPKSKPVIPPRSLAEPSLFEKLAANVQWLGVAVAGLLLVLVGVLVARRRKKFVVPQDEAGYLGVPAAPVNPPAEPGDTAAAPAPAADQDSNVFGSGFAPSATQLDSDEVDPVAEADAYLAYNRDAQAEEILKEALRRDPDHHAARLKLLDIYAMRGDARSFESHASELYALTRGQGEEWEQAAVLGRGLEPGNPLYAAGTGDAGGIGGIGGAGKTADDGYGVPLAAGVAAAAAAAAAYGAAHGDDAATPEFAAEPVNGADTAPAALADEPFLPASAEPFDFANDLETALPRAADASVSPASIAAQANAADFGLGDLDFTSPDLAPEPEAEAEAEAEQPLASAEDPSMDFSFDLPADPVPEEPAASSVPLDFGDTDFTIPEVPALVEPPAAPATPAEDNGSASTAQEFDLSGIDLDLSKSADEPPVVEEVSAADVARAEPMSALHMEMDTKLDLAVAYQEIGDKEGARELLDEVLRGGSDEQVAKANAMKAQLG
ncbi:MAG: FimV/HubP family polar landmark protein, partial [Duganella sp.]